MSTNMISKIIEGLNHVGEGKDYDIRPIPHTNGAYGVYDGNKLLVSADSRSEAEDELEDLQNREEVIHQYILSYDFVDRDDSSRHKEKVFKAHSEDEVKNTSEYKKLYRDKRVHNMRIQLLDK